MSAKSQFLATTENDGLSLGGNLLGSLTLAITDTRKGFDAPTQTLVGQLAAYAEEHSNSQRFNAYVAKIQPVATTTAQPAARVTTAAKMGSGM